ncbi:MAG: addiction module protein [Balneolaceae bacterium]
MIKDNIQQNALKLPEKERAELAQMLIESLTVESKYETEEAWAKELKRRIEEYESGEGSSTPWSEVKKNAKAMLDQ